MKIITWNCNGAFRKKYQALNQFDADIYIIQECENPDESTGAYKDWAENYVWKGDSKNKGLGIFAKKEVKLEKLDWSNVYSLSERHIQIVKHFLPCRINGQWNLLGVWTHYNKSPTFNYIGQFWKYLQINKDRLDNVIIAGDFNSNVRWDQSDRWWNHSDVVRELKDLNIESLYHRFFNEQQGLEKQPTLYFRKAIQKPYHIDYIFTEKSITDNLLEIEVGKYDDWISLSDHMPVIAEFNQ